MTWSAYAAFLAFAVVLILVPGPDFAVVTRNALAGGPVRGRWSALGVASSNLVQGVAAVAGLGAVIVRIEPLFQAVKWAGVAYLAFLAVQSFRSAIRGRYADLDGGDGGAGGGAGSVLSGGRLAGWRQGFLSNVTNPKVLVFYLAVLPQFLGPDAPVAALVVFALSHAALGLAYLLLLVTGLTRARRLLSRRRVRRALDAATGTALAGFTVKLATEQH